MRFHCKSEAAICDCLQSFRMYCSNMDADCRKQLLQSDALSYWTCPNVLRRGFKFIRQVWISKFKIQTLWKSKVLEKGENPKWVICNHQFTSMAVLIRSSDHPIISMLSLWLIRIGCFYESETIEIADHWWPPVIRTCNRLPVIWSAEHFGSEIQRPAMFLEN